MILCANSDAVARRRGCHDARGEARLDRAASHRGSTNQAPPSSAARHAATDQATARGSTHSAHAQFVLRIAATIERTQRDPLTSCILCRYVCICAGKTCMHHLASAALHASRAYVISKHVPPSQTCCHFQAHAAALLCRECLSALAALSSLCCNPQSEILRPDIIRRSGIDPRKVDRRRHPTTQAPDSMPKDFVSPPNVLCTAAPLR